jgi:transcriptional regulator with XRE-family HTH domain
MRRTDVATDADQADLGGRVQHLRKRKGWTLTELSERCGISPSALSKIERNRLSPTYANIVRLAQGLEVNTSELFGGVGGTVPAEQRLSVMRLDEGDPIDTGNYMHYYLHMRLPVRAMTPLIVDHKARTLEEFGPMIVHAGEEFSYVLSGVIDVYTGDHPPTRLHPGESIYFDSRMPHAYLAVSRSPCRTLSVCSDLDQDELIQLLTSSRLP